MFVEGEGWVWGVGGEGLVGGVEFVEEVFGVVGVSGKVGGEDVDVVRGRERVFVVVNVDGVKVCDVGFDGFDGVGVWF